jgi:hypothetical protein
MEILFPLNFFKKVCVLIKLGLYGYLKRSKKNFVLAALNSLSSKV